MHGLANVKMQHLTFSTTNTVPKYKLPEQWRHFSVDQDELQTSSHYQPFSSRASSAERKAKTKAQTSLFKSSVPNCETQNICLICVYVTVYGRSRTEHSSAFGYSIEYTVHFIIWNKNQLMSLFQFYLYTAGSLHVSGPQAHPQESSHSCSHNHWFSVCTALAMCSVCCGAHGQSSTDTEPMVVWTAVWTLLRMGLWARNM